MPLTEAAEIIYQCTGRVVLTGMGKSGLVCKKIASTLSSTGTPALFVHPADSLHGDLGMLQRNDVLMIVSNSGETEEVLKIIPWIKRLDIPVITITGDRRIDDRPPGKCRADSGGGRGVSL